MSAITASGLSAATALVLVVIGAATPMAFGQARTLALLAALGSAVGAVVGWYLGWTRAADAVSARAPSQVVWAVSWRAVLLGAALIAIMITVGSVHWPASVTDLTPDRIGDLVLYPLLGASFTASVAFFAGVVLFGAPALVLTVPMVIFWRRIVRRQLGASQP